MSTNLINSIQHRNGPNQRPPNSIFGNAGSNQKLLSNHLICGFLGAVSCGFALITYINYSLKHENSTGMKILAILSVSVFVIILLMACMLLICRRKEKRVIVVYCRTVPF
ncbi:hypothetical protein HA402_000824 [Bradysia odoriphaga]|nr:hypothetical protein HA402_000824 [Bradysia odoriphaga]